MCQTDINVTGEFVILRDGVLETYTNYADIPMSFDNLISFIPDVPPPPHTEAEHDIIHKMEHLFQEVFARETK